MMPFILGMTSWDIERLFVQVISLGLFLWIVLILRRLSTYWHHDQQARESVIREMRNTVTKLERQTEQILKATATSANGVAAIQQIEQHMREVNGKEPRP